LSCAFFIVTGLVEAASGLLQLYDFLPSQHALFKITGSFLNPGPYSGWLAMVFPMAFCYVIIRVMKNISEEKLVFNFSYIYIFLKNTR
jgi:hypothetical protein